MPARPRACRASPPFYRGKPGISAAAPNRAHPRRSSGPIISRSASPNSPRPTFPSGATASSRPTRRSVSCSPTMPTATRCATHMIPLFEKAGFTVFDPGGYEDGTTDYSSQIGKYKAAGVQIFTGVPIPPDFATFWRQSAQLGLAKTDQDPEHREDRLVPLADGSAWLARLQHRKPCLLASDIPLQIAADRQHIAGAGRAATRRASRPAMEPATRRHAVAARCWRPNCSRRHPIQRQGGGRQDA